MSKIITTNDFIERSKAIHGNKYDYSKSEYIDCNTKVCIICPEHGEFWQKPINHMNGNGCPLCNPKKKLHQDEIIKRFIEKHGSTYNYFKVIYKNIWSKVRIICPEHGEFYMTPAHHIKGQGCPICGKIKNDLSKYLTQEEVIKRFKDVHKNRYDYSLVNYKKIDDKVCIICPEHGEFWQLPYVHMHGCGCPRCKSSKLENKIYNFLMEENIDFIYQYQLDFLYNGKSHPSVDFFIPSLSIAIECQGDQHFKSVDHFGGVIEFEKLKLRDINKYNECKKKGINILYFANKQYNENMIVDLNKLKSEILKTKERH